MATAYSNFGKRVKVLKTKLDEKMPELERIKKMESISPIPRLVEILRLLLREIKPFFFKYV